MKLLIIYEQEALCFHFAMGAVNYFAGPTYLTLVLLGCAGLPSASNCTLSTRPLSSNQRNKQIRNSFGRCQLNAFKINFKCTNSYGRFMI